MRKRITAVALMVVALSLVAGMVFMSAAQADDVTNDNLGRSTETFYYNDGANPALGEFTVSAWGVKYDSDGDDDNDADYQRGKGLAVKKRGVLRIALRSRLQRFVVDRDGARWVTMSSSALINSGNTALSVRATSPAEPFRCGLEQYRAVSSGGVRYTNNFFEHFEEISGTWFARGPCVSS